MISRWSGRSAGPSGGRRTYRIAADVRVVHRRGRGDRRPARRPPGRRRRAGQRARAGRQARRDPRTGLTLVEPDGSVVVAPGGRRRQTTSPTSDRRTSSCCAEGAPDRRDRRSAGRRCTTTTRSSSRCRTACPWWFFQKLPGPVRGPSTADARPGRHHRAPHPARADRRRAIAYPAAERDAPGVIRLSRATGSRSASSTGRAIGAGRRDRRCAHRGRLHVAGPHRHPGPPLGQGVGQPGVQPDQRPHRGDARRDLPLTRPPARWRRR